MDVPLDMVLKTPTISGLCSYISERLSSTSVSPATPADTHDFLSNEVNQLASLIQPISLTEVQLETTGAHHRHIFLTGATGFVGVFTLGQLLVRTSPDTKVHCLVRALNPIDAMQRLQHALRVRNLWKDEFESR